MERGNKSMSVYDFGYVERQNREPSPSELIMDSQTVETATMVSNQVGYDSGKKIKGRKRHILVDTLGLLMIVVITAADVSEQAGAKQVLSKFNSLRDRVTRLIKIWVDGGYRGKDFTHWVIDVYRWLWSVVTRHEEQRGDLRGWGWKEKLIN